MKSFEISFEISVKFVLVGVFEYGNMIFVKSYFAQAKNTVSKNFSTRWR